MSVTTTYAQIYVSPTGSDKTQGTATRPFRTIQRAVEAVKKSPPGADTTFIYLYGGRYDLKQTVQINDQTTPLVIKPFQNQKVSITGGMKISAKAARPISDPAMRAMIANPAVRELDLRKMGVELDKLHPVGFGRPSTPCWNEFFIDGKPARIARYPNDTVMMIGKVHNTGDIPRENITGRGDAVFEYSEPRVNAWLGSSDMWISGYFAHGYADDMIPVRSIDTATHCITTAQPTRYGFMTGAPWRTWFAMNLPQEIDRQGEYVIDSVAGKLYFLATNASEFNVSILKSPLIAIEGSRDVRIEGVTFEYSRGMGVYIANSHNTLVKGCTLRNLGYWGVCIGNGADPLDKRVIGDLDEALYQNILLNRNGGTNNGVVDCQIYDLGSGGVQLSGGDRATLTAAGNYVDNCRIRDFNRIEKSYKGAVNVDGVGNRVSRVDISGAPSMAILIHGNNHVIEYCRITDVCREIDDQGAIYYGRDPSERGHIVRYCYFKELSPRHRVTATYHDDGACGMTCIGNIYLRAGSIPVLIGGGHDNRYLNNIFIDSPTAIHIDNRMQHWGKGMIEKGGVIDTRLQTIRYTEPPYSTTYPELVAYWGENPDLPKRNVIEGNLFVKVKNVLSGQTQWGEFYNNFATMKNPGFVDMDNPLKGFEPNAEVFKKIANFPNLPFDKIGCTLPLNPNL